MMIAGAVCRQLARGLTRPSRSSASLVAPMISSLGRGDQPSIADLSMCGYLYWPDEFGVDCVDYPNVGRWLAAIAALPGWVHPYQLMPGHPLPAKG